MRSPLAVSVVLLAGCPMTQGGGECHTDRECIADEVCARDNTCMAASKLRDVKAMWTIRGMPASAASCAGHPDLYIAFSGGPGQELGFSPVPCANGQFLITKLPATYDRVELGVHGLTSDVEIVDGGGLARLDIQ